MNEPVATVDGNVYEKAAIRNWFRRGNRTSPKTDMILPAITTVAERALQRAIEEYRLQRPELVRTEFHSRSLEGIDGSASWRWQIPFSRSKALKNI